MKRNYETPEMAQVILGMADVIVTSMSTGLEITTDEEPTKNWAEWF